MEASLPLPLNSVQALLQGFAGSELFWPVWQSCFGGDFDRRLASELQNQWRKGDFRDLPQIVVLPGKAMGIAQGPTPPPQTPCSWRKHSCAGQRRRPWWR